MVIKNISIYFIILLIFICIVPFSYAPNPNPQPDLPPIFTFHTSQSNPAETRERDKERYESSIANLGDYANQRLLMDLLFPSSDQLLGDFLMDLFVGKSTTGWGFSETSLMYALAEPHEFARRLCWRRMSEFFQPSYDVQRSGPSIGNALFVYGMYKKYDHLLLDGLPVNLYTISLNFNHPLSQDEFSELDSYDLRNDYYLSPDGKIKLSIVFVDESGGTHETAPTIIEVGESLDFTRSFYETIILKSLYLKFHDGYKHKFYTPESGDSVTSEFYPSNNPCRNVVENDNYAKIGCILEIEEDHYEGYPHGSSLVIEEDEEGGYFTGGGIPIGNTGSSQTSTTGFGGSGFWG